MAETPRVDGREALWDALRGALHAQRAGPALARLPRDATAPASSGQHRLWYLERLAPGSAVHNQTVAFALRGPLDAGALRDALGEAVRRHEPLRTTLRWTGEALVQQVHPPAPFELPLDDLRALPADARDAALERATEREARTPFELDRPPFLRARLLRTDDDAHRLLLTVHHLAFDGWSFEVLMGELGTLYGAFAAGAPSPLAEPALRYADWAAWQQALLRSGGLDASLRWWRERLADAPPPLRMPADRPRAARAGVARRGATATFALAPAASDAVRALAAREGATPFATLLAAFQVLLHRCSGADDLVVGAPVANRGHREVEGLVGFFVNLLPLRLRVAPTDPFRDVLARVRAQSVGALEHASVPFERLVEALGERARDGDTPLCRATFALHNLPRSRWSLPGLEVEAWNVGSGAAKGELSLVTWDGPDGYGGQLDYDADLFDAATAARWLRHYATLLEAFARDPSVPVGAVPLCDAEDLARLRDARRAARVPYPRGSTVHGAFEARVREAPHAVALLGDGGPVSRATLDARANRLAHRLIARGAAPGGRIGLCMHRAPGLVAAMLAILKAGAAIVPVDPAWPDARIARVLDGAQAAIADVSLAPRLADLGVATATVDRDGRALDDDGAPDGTDASPAVDVRADDCATVMSTSGSTGAPRGVRVPHRGIVRLVLGARHLEPRADDVFVQLAPVAFDASSFEVWTPLLGGAVLAVPSVQRPSLDAIAQAVGAYGATVLWLGSGLFEAMVDARPDAFGGLRALLVGGDVMSVPHARRFLRAHPGCRLVNCYGPTENATFTTFHPVAPGDCEDGRPIPIGRPVSNTEVHVVDGFGHPVPVGIVGELLAGGDGLMLGYLGDEAATRARRVPAPDADEPGALAYRTGDLVRWRDDGTLEFVGRHDDQVKVDGCRVEPGEVEAALAACTGVRRACVAPDGEGSARRLVAWVELDGARADAPAAVGALRDALRRRLPQALVPASIVAVDALPLDANGKPDRRRLRASAVAAPARGASGIAPRDTRERLVADAFERVLGTRPIGAHDDFLDLGGGSLAALRLVAALEDAFGVPLPLATFYASPTPAGVAAALERAAGEPAPALPRRDGAARVELRPGGCDAPLFLVPGGHGGPREMTLYAKVLARAAPGPAVVGLLAPGVDDDAPPHASVEACAAAWLDEIRRLQPRGPYRIAGECVGGLVAWEIAQRLVAAGERVEPLLLLDTWCPTLPGVLRHRWIDRPRAVRAARGAVARRGLADVRRVLGDHVRDRPPFSPRRSARYALDVARTLRRVARPWLDAIGAAGRPAPGDERAARAGAAYVEAAMRYRPGPYPGRVVLVACEASERLGLVPPWRALARGGLVVHRLPGDHETYLRDAPGAAAAVIERCLREAGDDADADAATVAPHGPGPARSPGGPAR